MDTIEVITSKGYKVYIKPRITYGDSLAIKQHIFSLATINPKTKNPEDVNFSLGMILAGNIKALELMVIKVVLPDGTEAKDPVQAVKDFDEADGELVMNAIDKVYKPAFLAKKNEIPSV